MNNKRLIIRLSPASLSFSTTSGGEVAFERYALKNSISLAANLREALRSVPMLQEEYSRVVVMVDSPVLLIPTDVYHQEEQEMLYRYSFTEQEQQLVLHYILPELNTVAIFSLHKDLRTVLSDRFGDSLRVQPLMATVWSHLYQKNFTGPRQKLFSYFHDKKLEVFAYGQNRFKFCNAFAASNDINDALYYLLSVWKQLGMEPVEGELHLYGDIPNRDALTNEARRYVKRVYVSNPSGEFNRAQVSTIEGMTYDLMVCYLKGL